MRISDWSSDVCSSDLLIGQPRHPRLKHLQPSARQRARWQAADQVGNLRAHGARDFRQERKACAFRYRTAVDVPPERRSEEHTSELQSLMRISYAVFCLKKKNKDPITLLNIHTKTYTNTKTENTSQISY